MDDLVLLEEMVNAYDGFVKSAEKQKAHPVIIDSLRHRRYQAQLDLEGARGAKGLNPQTGRAS